jgi:hypothetical protein
MTRDQLPPAGRITSERLHLALTSLQAATGIDVSGAELIKFTNNAVFRLPAAHAVARIAGSATMTSRIGKVIRVARWLEHHHISAVRLLPVEQPVEVQGLQATVWAEVPGDGPAVTGTDLAELLLHFHRLPAPDGGLPAWAPLAEIQGRLSEPDGVDADIVAYLHDECARLEVQLAGLQYALPVGPIHGDAFMGNLIAGTHGAVICDFDSTCIGPREWDLTPVAVGRLRFDYPRDDYGALAARYGFDVFQWPGFVVLRRLRELKLVTSLVPVLGSRPALRPQWEHRLQTYRAGDQETRWSAYSSVP